MAYSVHGKHLYWSPLTENDSPHLYSRVISNIFVILRTVTGHPSKYVIPLSPLQSTAGQRLLEALRKPSPLVEVVGSLHELGWCLIRKRDLATDVGECPFLSYFAARAMRNDGNFITPDVLAGLLAKAKYFCSNCTIIQAERTKHLYSGGMIE